METSIRFKANLLIKPTQARRQGDSIFKMFKKTVDQQFYIKQNYAFKMKLKYRKFLPSRPILKEILKEVVLSKRSRYQTITQRSLEIFCSGHLRKSLSNH